jgi:hypothetical protein
MVIARWQGELDTERFQRVLRDPESVDHVVESTLRGEERPEEEPRFAREDERELAPS